MRLSRKRLLRSIAAMIAAAVPLGLGTAASSAAVGRSAVGSAARLPSGAKLTGSLAGTTNLRLTIALDPRNASAMSAMATAVSTPGSPLFRHYLTVSQFAQRFGATDQQIAAVSSALSAAGLNVGQANANHLTLPVSGTATQVEKAFSTSLQQVRLASGRVAYANRSAATMPSTAASAVQGVIGLNNLVQMQPSGALRFRTSGLGAARPAARGNITTGGPQPCSTAQAAATADFGYTGDFLASMYNFSPLYTVGDLGSGQTVAIYELEGNFPNDVTMFAGCYGVSTPVNYQTVDGGPPAPDVNNLDGLETELDIETVLEMAPASHILVYQAPNTNAGALDNYSTIISANQAKVVSTSWGECEPLIQDFDPASVAAESNLFQEAALQGQSILGASGDAGSASCAQNDPAPDSSDDMLAVQDPTSQPFVTGVGGTTLWNGTTTGGFPNLWAPGQTLDEGVWNDGLGSGGPSASTGGISVFQKMPTYQSGASPLLGVGTGGSGTPCGNASGLCREVPDVSALADPNTGYVINYNGVWGTIGGTSGAAPLWAGFIADADASTRCRGLSVGFLNNSLYSLASSSAYSSDFHDVTLANPATGFAHNDALKGTGNDPANGLYPVHAGYSMATGLGSPNVANLAGALCGIRAPTFTVSVSNPGARQAVVGKATSLTVHASDSGSSPITYSASGLPAGLALNSTTGVISGKPTTAQKATVSVRATDAVRNVGTTQFAWTVVKPQKASFKKPKLSGLGKGRPKLTFAVAQGKYAPALRSVSVKLPKGLSFGKRRTLARGIVAKHGRKRVRFTVVVKHGVLMIRFKSTQSSVSLTLTKPTLAISKSEASKIKHHKIKKLTVRLTTTDASRKSVKVSKSLKVS